MGGIANRMLLIFLGLAVPGLACSSPSFAGPLTPLAVDSLRANKEMRRAGRRAASVSGLWC